jgi:predicted chitinase
MTRSDAVALVAAILSFAGVIYGVRASGKANARTARNTESATNLDWVKQARGDAERAEERLDKVEQAAAEMADWIWDVVAAARDPQVDADELRRRINGGPRGVQRYRTK